MNVTRTQHHEWLFGIGLALLASMSIAGVVAASFERGEEIEVRLSPVAGDEAAEITEDGDGVLLRGGSSALSRARMNFELPPAVAGGQRWVMLFNRSAVEEISIGNADWQGPVRRFFAPHLDEGAIPAVFAFDLPADWQGPVELELRVRSSVRNLLQPQLLREDGATRIEQRTIALATSVYAGLFMLALVMLALFHAAHDRVFLAYFGFALSALLMVAALNGHLYLLPGFRMLAAWRDQGIIALTMLFSAAALQIMMRYAGLRASSPQANALAKIACTILLAIAGLALLGLDVLHGALQDTSMAGWVMASFGCTAIGFDAARRRVPMALPIALLCLLVGIAAVVAELLSRGHVAESWWARRGYQVALVAWAAALAIGLAARISDFRSQRDRARLAHEDSDRRAAREAARLALSEGLQSQLKLLAPGDLEWTAYRRVLDQLRRMLELDAAAVAVYGSSEDEEALLLAEPNECKPRLVKLVSQRSAMLKSLARARAPLQVTLDESDVPTTVSATVPAVVPLLMRAPAWGVMILERGSGDGFTTDELALASEFGRLAVQAIDEANAAIRLRRSAEMDALTGALNRRTLDQWLTRSFTEAHRHNKELSVLFVDLDNFKSINDTHGHAAGDHCLRRVSAALRSVIGKHDLLGRYGGEEFLVASTGIHSETARQLGERIRGAVEELPVEWNGRSLRLTASVGVASRWRHEQAPHETIERADKALYAAKRGGRNRVSVAPAVFM